jgi:type VI secretion system secreted protein Hcp
MKPLADRMQIPRSSVVALIPVAMAATLVASGPAVGAETIFLKLQGIAGEATAAGHKDEIVVSSYSQAMSNTVGVVASGGGSGAGKAICGAISVTKSLDKSSPLLIGAVAQGQRIATGEITFESTGATGASVVSYKIALQDIVISLIEQTDQVPAGVIDHVTFNAARYAFTYTPALHSGAAAGPITFNWDCAKNAKF